MNGRLPFFAAVLLALSEPLFLSDVCWADESAAASTTAPAQDVAADEFFEREIRPLLAERCQKCHGAAKQQGGLRLDSAAAISKGSENGPVVMPGSPDTSTLIQAIRYADDPKMPPDGKLPDQAIASLAEWVKRGAVWPKAAASSPQTPSTGEQHTWRDHWAFHPLVEPPLPDVAHPAWAETAVDRFVVARLEPKGLEPSPPADRAVLIRRATFDLLGLPPRPEEVTRICGRLRPRRLSAFDRSTIGSAAVWRTLGPALARLGAVLRHQRLSGGRRRSRLSLRVYLSRLGDPSVQRRPAVRSISGPADCRRLPAKVGRQAAAGSAGVPNAGTSISQ